MERRATQNGRSATNEATVTGKRLKYSIDEILGMGDADLTERAEKHSLHKRSIKYERQSPLAGEKLYLLRNYFFSHTENQKISSCREGKVGKNILKVGCKVAKSILREALYETKAI